jgi:hypothetical protein
MLVLAERFVAAIESIALSMEGLNASSKKAVNSVFPERREPGEARVTHVPTEEDILEEELGQSDTRPITQWGSFGTDDEPIGVREHEFIERSSAKAQGSATTLSGSLEAPED